MATQLEVIQKFMKSLDTHTLTKKSNETSDAFATRIIDAAVKACSNFGGAQAVIKQMLADYQTAGDATTFLKNFCGIDLSNKDTGAITGADAGGSTVKTCKSIVPESSAVTDWVAPKSGSSTTISGLKVNWPTVGANGKNFTAEEKFILKGLNSEWIKQALKLAKDSYGIDFNTSGAYVKTIDVKFENNSTNGVQASTSRTDPNNDGKIDSLMLTVNMHYYSKIDTTSPDGATEDATWLDRTISHELIHAIMATNVYQYDYIPSFVKEGLAELVHGIDDDNPSGIKKMAGNVAYLKQALSLADFSNIKISGVPNPTYAAGYMFMRYLAKQALVRGKDIVNKTANKKITGTALNDTINNLSGGTKVTIVGGAGNDSIRNSANASIIGGAGDDTIINTDLGDKATLLGGDGKDYITTYNADSVSIDGGQNNDMIELRGSGKKITVTGGAGDDTVFIAGGTALVKYVSGNDSIAGFNADSTLQIGDGTGTYTSATSGNNLILTVGSYKVTLQGAAKLSTVNIVGKKVSSTGKNISDSKSNTLITGTAYADTIYSTGSKVTINALGGKDSIHNRGANASINAGADDDKIYNAGTNVKIVGYTGNDDIDNRGATVTIDAGADDDKIYNTGKKVTILGGDGLDTIRNYGSNVSIHGGAGNDRIYNYASSAVTLQGGAGNDSLWGGTGKDTFIYASGDGKDVISGFGSNDLLKITGTFSASYNSSAKSIAFKVGKASNAITLKDFGTTTTFHVNDTTYQLSSGKLTQK